MISLWKEQNICRQTGAIPSYRNYLVLIGFISLLVLAIFTTSVTGQEEEGNNEECTKSSKEENGKPSKERYDKSARTPVQRKISSELLERIQGKENATRQPTTPESKPNKDDQRDNIALVDIKATVTESLLKHIETLGGTVINSFPEFQAIRVKIPVEELETLAELSEIVSIRAADTYQLQR